MGALGAMMVLPAAAPELSGAGELLGYRELLRDSLRRLLEHEGVATSDPRVLSLTAHLARRQAAVEVEEELRRSTAGPADKQLLRQKLVADFYRGVDLRYSS